MILAENSIKPFLQKNLPWFVNQSYPTFIEFLKYYYQWLETFDIENAYGVLALLDHFEKFHDIDQTLNELIPRFKSIYARLIPEDTVVSSRLFLKHLSELYRSKGTEGSFKILIYILTGQDSTLFYPKELLFKTSHIPYDIETFIQFELTNSDLTEDHVFQLAKIPITIDDKPYMIDRVVKVCNCFRFYIQFSPTDSISEGKVYLNGIEIGQCKKVLSAVSIVSSSPLSDTSGTKVLIIPSPEEGSTPAIAKITNFKRDQVRNYVINAGGIGYTLNDTITSEINGCQVHSKITQLGPKGQIEKIQIIASHLFDQLPPVTINSLTGSGASITWTSAEIGKPIGISLLDSGNNFPNDPFTQIIDTIILYCVPDFISRIAHWYKTKNLLGQYNILPDNYYYQRFSYDLITEHSPFLNKESITDLLHVPGYKQFYTLFIGSTIEHSSSTVITDFSLTQEAYAVEKIIDTTPPQYTTFLYESIKYTDTVPVLNDYPNNNFKFLYPMDLVSVGIQLTQG